MNIFMATSFERKKFTQPKGRGPGKIKGVLGYKQVRVKLPSMMDGMN
jgi:hypothetical protein